MDDDAQDTSPQRYRTLANGAIYDMEVKRIVANPGGGTKAITYDNTYTMHERKRAQARAKYLSGMMEGAGAATKLDVLYHLGKTQAIIATDPDKGRSATVAAEMSLKFLDLWPKQEQQAAGTNTLTLTMTDAVAQRVAEMVAKGRNG